MSGEPNGSTELLTAFQAHYHQFAQAVHNALQSAADAIVLARLGDDVDEYASLVHKVSYFQWHTLT